MHKSRFARRDVVFDQKRNLRRHLSGFDRIRLRGLFQRRARVLFYLLFHFAHLPESFRVQALCLVDVGSAKGVPALIVDTMGVIVRVFRAVDVGSAKGVPAIIVATMGVIVRARGFVRPVAEAVPKDAIRIAIKTKANSAKSIFFIRSILPFIRRSRKSVNRRRSNSQIVSRRLYHSLIYSLDPRD